MILFSSPPSPFGRKIKIALSCLGMRDDVTVKQTNTMNPEDDIRGVNPLGKIPALVVDDMVLFDSRVILDYLDARAGGGKILPASGPDRFNVMSMAALADGILDAAILVIYESRLRPEGMQVESFVEFQRDKIIRSLQGMPMENYDNGAMPDVAEIGLACALDYLDFRKQVEWRDHAPHLVGWKDGFAAAVPGYADTMPSD
jgi:glutathione S-transferase